MNVKLERHLFGVRTDPRVEPIREAVFGMVK